MIGRALDAQTAAGWVSGDEVYGADLGLRASLEKRQVSYVLAVARSHPVTTAAGSLRADALAARLPPRVAAAVGRSWRQGHRWYDWAWVAIDPYQRQAADDP
jgi:hypothetical protein